MTAKIHSSITELIGHTPLVELHGLEKKENISARLIVKPEFRNPGGSIKDRIALAMIEAAEKDGKLKPGGVIIEPTSGNAGIGLAACAAAKGYRLVVTMPESMSMERRKLIAAYGAELVLTPAASGMPGAIGKAKELAARIPNSIIAGQFVNPANPEAHRASTGPEIWEDTAGAIDYFVAGVGTGGTITGVGEYLKSCKPDLKIVAVEPAASPVLSGGAPGPHKIQGIGAGFVPEVLNTAIYDEIIQIGNDAAMRASRLAAQCDGLLVGISSGAALAAAITLASRPENSGKMIVALLPDGGERYLSTELWEAATE